MFSGIVEAQARVLSAIPDAGILRIDIEKPNNFDDLKIGDSVATDGVCLTVERVDARAVSFALGAETLRVTGWTAQSLAERSVNLERSLRMGDRVHGHFVTGHVDAMGEVDSVRDAGGSVFLDVRAPAWTLPYAWKKGSWALNGVSLTINEVAGDIISHCLIPETLRRTNLSALRPGSPVAIELDSTARAFVRSLELTARPPAALKGGA